MKFVGLQHFCKCSADVNFALWSVWASCYQPRRRYIQYINTDTPQTQVHGKHACIHTFVGNYKCTEGACRGKCFCIIITSAPPRICYCMFSSSCLFPRFPTEPYICWHSVLFLANVCQKWTECLACLLQLSAAGLCSVLGVCSAFIHCLLMSYPHYIRSRIHLMH